MLILVVKWLFVSWKWVVSDIAIFVLKRDVKLQLTVNSWKWLMMQWCVSGVNLLIGTENGLVLLDRSGQGKSQFLALILSHCFTCYACYIIAVSLQVKAMILSILVRCWLCWGFQLLESPSQFTTTTATVLRPFSGTSRVSRCQKRTSGLYDARED